MVTKIAMAGHAEEDPVVELLLSPEKWTMVLPSDVAEDVQRTAPQARLKWSVANAHRNTHREILFCVKGRGYFGMGGRLYSAHPGRLFIIDPNVPHDDYYPKTGEPMEHIWIRQLGDRVITGWSRIDGGKLTRLHDDLSVLTQEQIGAKLPSFPDETVAITTPFDAARLRLLVGLVATYLAQHFGGGTSGASVALAGAMPAKVVEAVRNHIDASAGKNASLDFLAHFSGYSKFHLLRIFQAQVGCSIHQYVDRARAKRTRQLQAEGVTNRVAAEALGFSSPTSYLRWRRKRKGKVQTRT